MKVKRAVKIEAYSCQIGDIISFRLITGEKVKAMAVEQDADGMVFVAVNCLGEPRRMNPTNTTEGGYDASELRKILNTNILATFPEKIKAEMVSVYEDDLLTVPCKENIFGGKDCKPWKPMKKRRNRIAYRGKDEILEWYWLRDVVSASAFAIVSYGGSALYYSASDVFGVRPTFKLRNRKIQNL